MTAGNYVMANEQTKKNPAEQDIFLHDRIFLALQD